MFRAIGRLVLAAVVAASFSPSGAEAIAPDAAAKPVVQLTPNQVIDKLPCVQFEWHDAPGVSERAAMLLPVEIDGRAYQFQLDTGSDASYLYGAAPDGKAINVSPSPNVTLSNVKIGGRELSDKRFYLRKDWPAGGGLFGIDILLGHYTVIDYPRRRLCILEPHEMPDTLLGATKSAWGTFRGSKFYVPVKVDGETLENVFFDTGASSAYLMLEQSAWLKATGLKSAAAAPKQVETQGWNDKQFISRAPVTARVEVAGVTLHVPSVDTWRDKPDFFATFPTKTDGLMGNAAFWDGIVILDLTPLMLFRFIPGDRLNVPAGN